MNKILSLMLVFGLFGINLLLPVKQARAGSHSNSSSASASVNNIIPVASSVSIDLGGALDIATVTLTEDTTTTVTVTAVLTDNNGCQNISGAEVKLYRTNASGSADDENHRYTVTNATVSNCTGPTDLTGTWTANVEVEYYADRTDAGAHSGTTWTASVKPSDVDSMASFNGTADTDTTEFATLKALKVTATIEYGALALNASTGTGDDTTVVTNTGNRNIATQVNGYSGSTHNTNTDNSMTCTLGSIPVENQRYDIDPNVTYASKVQALSGSANTVLNFSVPQRTGSVSTGNIHWGFKLPATGVSGNCDGTVVFTAIDD